ncbi:MAG: DNA polymerase IV [Acholeplasmatales bacterium]|jgi:DNA polymerase-4|nr:DNA polymerase IV [Acholeplasmatales bacterium]
MRKQNNAKIILHVDMNAFFCSVACLLNPALRGKVFAIGRENSYRGVISSASYEARALGIHSAMSLKEAYTLVPDLIVVSIEYSYYTYYHHQFLHILQQYSSLVQVASIDEAFIDITELSKTRHPLVIAKEIQLRILKEVGLSCSIGIAPTLFLAKMASDLKKPLGITVLRKRDVQTILYPLSVSDIFGIGKKTYPILINNNIKKISDFMNLENRNKILDLIGPTSYHNTYESILGNSTNIVDPNRRSESESISTSQTFDQIIQSQIEVLYELRKMTLELMNKLRKRKYYTKTITIVLRNVDFKTITRSKSINYTDDFDEIYDTIVDLVEEHYKDEPLRLLGVGLSNLKEYHTLPKEYNLFTIPNVEEKQVTISKLIKEYQNKYGEKALFQEKKKNL